MAYKQNTSNLKIKKIMSINITQVLCSRVLNAKKRFQSHPGFESFDQLLYFSSKTSFVSSNKVIICCLVCTDEHKIFFFPKALRLNL